MTPKPGGIDNEAPALYNGRTAFVVICRSLQPR